MIKKEHIFLTHCQRKKRLNIVWFKIYELNLNTIYYTKVLFLFNYQLDRIFLSKELNDGKGLNIGT